MFSAPYTPQQNGGVERTNRSLQEMARAMIMDSKLGYQIWGEALTTSAYIMNRIVRKGLGMTPYEKVTGRAPDVRHLVPFGTEVHIRINDTRTNKFDSKTEEAYVVGFTDRSNTYRVLTKNDKKVKTTSDIIKCPHNKTSVSLDDVRREPEVVLFTPENRQTRSNFLQKYFDKYLEELQNEARGNQDQVPINTRNMTSIQESENADLLQTTQVQAPQTNEELEISHCALTNDPSVDSDQTIINTGVRASTPAIDISNPFSQEYERIEENEFYNEVNITTEGVPESFNEAVTSTAKDDWIEAVKSELDAHRKNNTWVVVDKPDDKQPISAKWVFTTKKDKAGNIIRHKARLVARGFQQKAGIDYTEIYAPVAGIETIRFLLALCAQKCLVFKQFDISTAFLHGTIEETIYMQAPCGVKLKNDKCLRLVKSLYGLKQAPRAWFSKMSQELFKIGLSPLKIEPCVYTNETKDIIVSVYVDDGIVIAKSERQCQMIIEKLRECFDVKDTTGQMFLGIEIEQTNDSITLNQSRYILELIEKFKLTDCKGQDSININAADLQQWLPQEKQTSAPYRSLIGGLLYLAIATRPDILFAVNFLSRFNSNARDKHWTAAKTILKYLKNTAHLKITYKEGDRKLIAYSDADWAGDKADRKSVSGGCILFAQGPIVYHSRKQSSVAQSTCEAELVAAAEVAKSVKWLTMFAEELGVLLDSPNLLLDSQSAIALIKNDITNRRSRHIEIKFFLVRQMVKEKLFSLVYTPTTDQLADIFTKILSPTQFTHLRQKLQFTIENKKK